MKKLALAAMIFAATGSSAFAAQKCDKILFWTICTEQPPVHRHPVSAPEINAASALAALALMAGGLAVLRGRRAKGITV